MKKWSERSKKNKISFILCVFAWVLIALAAYIVYGLRQKNIFFYIFVFFSLTLALFSDLIKCSETRTKKELIKIAIAKTTSFLIIIFVI